ncbi:type I restriction endonuclease subunit R [Draconibacterium halophilum]|uniref:Type I restriction endonuclease subunit R n=1 Tax=Draconibacterium halophilum TaxID=2706887 RepID=A0A6C0R9F8_9BACT|nr:type I restriction endonuclease [Draconibacterium halophilum]QIA07128.1 type I restriction endonuclease subunit R [Draconibacterium halophilum]
MSKHTEIRFEEAIEQALVPSGGYIKGDPKAYDIDKALFPGDVIGFIQDTQKKKWEALVDIIGDRAEETLVNDLVKELGLKGSLHVLRHGFKCFGKAFRLAYFTPNTKINNQAWEDYEKNILTVTRQVHFSPKNPALSLDVVLSLNGLPVVTLELKNHMTGQTIDNAIHQYKFDRHPADPIFRFKERALVHFAVDPDLVSMTTKLAGKDTFFLPFNKGHNYGAGNPPNDNNYKTAYLWEEVLQKDSLLDILSRFMHLQVEEKQVVTKKGIVRKTKETMIFPRYHQLDAVRCLVGDSKHKGSGHNYLIQHSAGSGKSNSIAWLAHRLSSLHNEQDEKIFDSVIVITDRRVLDQQLQDTIYQFEHKQGVVKKIDEDTKQLAKALSGGVPIIISTIQKFPFIAQAIETLEKKGEGVKIDTAGKRFAVIVDEAHSSQSGESAMELRKVLNRDGIQSAIAEQILDMDDEELSDEAKEAILMEMLKRPQQKNISYFAFTATPKFKTLAVFNEPGKTGKSPFHHYSMKQAIQEGFIMDVLEKYTNYKTYCGLIKSIEDDPEVPKKKAALALARFMSLHPHNISQKVEVIVEHFRAFTKHKIGGRAKAMVVTRSRLHAVKYKLEFDRYIKDKGYTDVKSLVAFSGTVIDPDFPDKSYSETGMNLGVKETELPEKFSTDEYQVLLVAEKYQTGFDQPLLHTMYVDKRLSGIQAVQTLSRLNRIASGKEDTFVLDFENDREEIYESFKPYYEITEKGPDGDPHQLYTLQHGLQEYRVFTEEEITALCDVWFKNRQEPTPGDHKKMNSILDKAIERFGDLEEQEQEEFKSKLVSFRNLYSFLSQVIPYQDSDLEKLYTYLRFLNTKLPKRQTGKFELEDEVELKYYRLQKISEGSIDLEAGEAEQLYGATEVGTGSAKEEEVQLSTLVNKLNDRFGTEFTLADQLFFDQVIETAMEDEKIREAAEVNSYENFMYYFGKMLEGLFIERMDGNEEIFTKLMNDDKMMQVAAKQVGKDVYNRVRK